MVAGGTVYVQLNISAVFMLHQSQLRIALLVELYRVETWGHFNVRNLQYLTTAACKTWFSLLVSIPHPAALQGRQLRTMQLDVTALYRYGLTQGRIGYRPNDTNDSKTGTVERLAGVTGLGAHELLARAMKGHLIVIQILHFWCALQLKACIISINRSFILRMRL
jgi:hypothetical protein